MSDRFVLITGCSGGGKSTLLAELKARGHHGVDEPGRRIVRAEQAVGGRALPWMDMEAFLRRALEMAVADRVLAQGLTGWVFFDRGVIDAASGLGETTLKAFGEAHRYHRRVFVAPPWPEIHQTDGERRHGFEAALTEYERLRIGLPALGYEVVVLPKSNVAERAEFVLAILGDERP